MRWFDLESRAAKILTFLERNETSNIDELAGKLKVSSRTIQNELLKLNKELDGTAKIDIRKKLIKLYIFDHHAYNLIAEEIKRFEKNFDNPINRIAYIADNLLNSREFVLIDDLAFDINVSRSTLNKDLKILRNILSEYNLKLTGKANTGITILGREYDIRRFILENTYDMIYSSNILDSDIDQAFFNIMNHHGVEMTSILLIRKYMVLGLDRYLNGFPVEPFNKDKNWPENLKLYQIVKEISEEISKKLGINLPKSEEIFLLIPLIGMRTPLNISDFNEVIDIEQPVIELADRIIQILKQETEMSFQFDESLEDFIYHLNFLFNRLEFQMFLENPVKEDIKRKYALAWSLAERAASIIEDVTKRTVSDDEIGFLSTYFEIIIKEQKQRKRKHIRILVLHLKGGATRRLITYQLKKILSSDMTVDFESFKPGEINNYQNYDLIITTGPTGLKLDIPIIELDEVVDEKILKQQIDRIQSINSFNLISNLKAKSTLLSLLNENGFYIFGKDQSYLEVLKEMCEDITDARQADSEFFERLIRREKKSTMDFTLNLSFPHTTHKAGKKPFILLGLTPEGLMDKERLRVIILAGLPEDAEDDLTLVQLYEEVLKLGEDIAIVDEISKYKSYSDLLNFLVIEKKVFD